MRMHGGQGGDGKDMAGQDDGWDLFGFDGLDAVAGLVEWGDAGYARDVDYTAAVRAAKSGQVLMRRALVRIAGPGARVVTQAWCTQWGEPVVLVAVEVAPRRWCGWVARVADAEEWVRTRGDGPLSARDLLRFQRPRDVFTPLLRRAWARCPAPVAAVRDGRARG